MAPPAVTVQRHASALGRWEMIRRAAPGALRPHVLGYLGYREWTPGPFRRLEVPSGEVHVIVSFGPEVRCPAPVRSFVAAPHSRHAVVDSDGEQHGVELRLTPLGTHMLLGVPMHELADRVVPIEDLLGRDGAELPERLHDAGTWPQRFALLDRLLARRLEDARAPAPGVEHTWWRLVQTHGRASVETIVPAALGAGWALTVGLADERADRAIVRLVSPARSAGAAGTSSAASASTPACRRRCSRGSCASSAPPR
jgi:hypothetical protein